MFSSRERLAAGAMGWQLRHDYRVHRGHDERERKLATKRFEVFIDTHVQSGGIGRRLYEDATME